MSADKALATSQDSLVELTDNSGEVGDDAPQGPLAVPVDDEEMDAGEESV